MGKKLKVILFSVLLLSGYIMMRKNILRIMTLFLLAEWGRYGRGCALILF